MRICQISSTYPPFKDGVGDSVAKLHRLLNLSNHSSYVLTSINVPNEERIINVIDKWSFIEILKAQFSLKKRKVDIIIIHYPTTFYYRKLFVTFIPLLNQLLKIKTILYLHEYSNYSTLGKLRILPMILFSNFVVTSDFVNCKKISWLKKDHKIKAIPGGSNFSDEIFQNIIHKPKRNNRKIRVLFFGFIRHGKGLENLVDVVCSDKNISNNYELIIVGGVSENVDPKSIELLNKIKKNKNIKYLGFLNETNIKSLAENIDIVFLPFSDGLTERRGSFMTGMGLGLTVVTTEPKKSISSLKNFDNVIFIKNSSFDEIKSILDKVMTLKSEKLNEIGIRAKKWYIDGYSDEKFIKKFVDVFEGL